MSGDSGSSQDRQSIVVRNTCTSLIPLVLIFFPFSFVQLDHDISFLLALQDLNSIVAISSSGQLSQLDSDLTIRNTWVPRRTSQTVRKVFLSPQRTCRFLPQALLQNGYNLIMFLEHDSKLALQIILIGTEGELTVQDELEVPLENSSDVVDISFDPSGNLSILCRSFPGTIYVLD